MTYSSHNDKLPAKIPAELGSDLKALESQLLGALLIKDGKIIPDIQSLLTPDDFYFPDYKVIYKAIVDLFNRNTPPSIISVIEELKSTGQFSNDILKSVVELGEVSFTDAYAKADAAKIKEYSTRRKFFELSLHLNRKAYKLDKSLDELSNFADSSLREITSNNTEPKFIPKSDFYLNFFGDKLKDAQKYSNRKTGFSNIDQLQIFSPGLYVLGATPACGKTTFALQLLEQLVDRGESCLLCNYEMSIFELFTKSLARELFTRDRLTMITAADIRNGAQSVLLKQIYSDITNRPNEINLVELRDENVDDLLRILRPYCTDKDKSPVVCIDYLQIIPPSNDVKLTTDKARIDDIVHKLKTFQRETNTTFIVISSFNRVNYYSQVSFESFKDSGNIEYTADVVWALQMFVANTVKDGANISATRKKFDDAKKLQPRQLHLKCLKNRQGNNYDCYFNYYSAHDFFEPATLTDFVAEEKAAQVESKDTAQKDNATTKYDNDKASDDTELGVLVSDDENRRLEDFLNSFN